MYAVLTYLQEDGHTEESEPPAGSLADMKVIHVFSSMGIVSFPAAFP